MQTRMSDLGPARLEDTQEDRRDAGGLAVVQGYDAAKGGNLFTLELGKQGQATCSASSRWLDRKPTKDVGPAQ